MCYQNFCQEKIIPQKSKYRALCQKMIYHSEFSAGREICKIFFTVGSYNLRTSHNSIKLTAMNYDMTLKITFMKDILKLKDSNHRFTLTFDEQSSTRNNKRYININIQFICSNKAYFWKLGLVRIYISLPPKACIRILNDNCRNMTYSQIRI